MKIKLAALAAIAAGAGYTGSQSDPEAIKKFLTDNNVTVNSTDGKALDLATIEIEKAGKTVTLPADAEVKSIPSQAPAPQPFDAKAYVAAAVESELKKLNLLNASGRPGNPVAAVESVSVKSGHQLRYEDNVKNKTSAFRSYDTALAFANHVIGLSGIKLGKPEIYTPALEQYAQICKAKGYVTTNNAGGGALVPEQFWADIINLVKDYGVARRVANVIPMTSDRVIRPKVTGTHTVYYPAEAGTATASTQTFSNTGLSAKTGVVMSRLSIQIVADAAINIIDHAVREMARAISKIEDDSLFNGDGLGVVSGYIPGVQGFTALNTDTSDNSRTVIGGGTATAHAIGDLTQMMGLLPRYARGRAAFHCTPEMGDMILLRLAAAQGGATMREFADFGETLTVFGRPVIYNNSMNITESATANTTDILYGDISLAADFGDRMGIQVDTSDDRYFDTLETAVRLTVRHDINVHDLGSTTTQSPVVFLKQS